MLSSAVGQNARRPVMDRTDACNRCWIYFYLIELKGFYFL
jgi:hypothetical protein